MAFGGGRSTVARVTEISSAIMGEEEMAQRLTHTLVLVPPRVAFVALHKANLLALANCLFGLRRALSRRHFST